MNGLLFRTALGSGESDVPSHDLHPLVGLAKLPNPIVAKTPGHSAHQGCLAHAPGNGDQDDKILVENTAGKLGVELAAFAVQLDQTLDRLSVAKHVGVGRVLGF